ncbi:MAG: UDP-N-acetylglucosamine 1-carboxyvinyltransferase [Candidatus Roizmanbacteria bacterium GW2011_GWC2_34_23]|uniref:UDP-N-acetylglucosamine 1-carboxyvinyltransferase n=1 Tax=Candidatus Roizmanbacteria bacterium GW2011_GWC2_34_23 TaxID=1618484 RepID=A0A0G0DZ52_9BACT|nr:MAG: UDP-N-acetylglucosamine 1-carboxyvinyltransferase [Candidatus Roizmanbacteria bacterium GW2011_GWC2_34_23]
MTDSYIIKGGKPLKGEVILSGAKNVALKTIIAALMFKGNVILKNIPKINDVLDLIELIKSLGATARFMEKNTLIINGDSLKNNKVELQYGSKIRVSFMLIAPLLNRFGECFVPNPGGCRIGARPIDRIIKGLVALGVKINYDTETGYYHAKIVNKPKGNYRFEKPSHTGTELLMMIGLMTDEKVEIENIANEPEIDDLILYLNSSGANILEESNKIIVNKCPELRQKETFTIMSDRNELVTYATLAVASGGDVTISPINKNLISSFLKIMKIAGAGVEEISNYKYRFFYQGKIKPVNIETSPHPGFMTDWQPSWAILMLKANGPSVIHERVFENRFSYVNELKKFGANIDFVDVKVNDPDSYYHFNHDKNRAYQQTIKIVGSSELHNAVLNIGDLRAGAALACGALLANGESVVNGASILERGYEDFVGKVKKLGGEIKKV